MRTVRVAIAGGQDTGKTTLARTLAGHYSSQGVMTEYVSEYAREYIAKYGAITQKEQYIITAKQIEKETIIPKAVDLMFTDSPVFLGYVYAVLFQDPDQTNARFMLTEMFSLAQATKYDVVLFLEPFATPRKDGIRTPELIAANGKISRMIEGYLNLYGIDYQTLSGDFGAKAKTAKAWIDLVLEARR